MPKNIHQILEEAKRETEEIKKRSEDFIRMVHNFTQDMKETCENTCPICSKKGTSKAVRKVTKMGKMS